MTVEEKRNRKLHAFRALLGKPRSGKYGVGNVVGGFAPHVTNSLPYALERTRIEQEDVRSLLERFGGGRSIELGCGFGRMLPALGPGAIGYERDHELRRIACDLGHDARPFPIAGQFDTALTFTFLQHLTDGEARSILGSLRATGVSTIIICEQTLAQYDTRGCQSRTYEQYSEFLPGFSLVHLQPRRMECGRTGGSEYMVFKRN